MQQKLTFIVVYCRPFSSKAVFRAILKEFEFAIYSFTVLCCRIRHSIIRNSKRRTQTPLKFRLNERPVKTKRVVRKHNIFRFFSFKNSLFKWCFCYCNLSTQISEVPLRSCQSSHAMSRNLFVRLTAAKKSRPCILAPVVTKTRNDLQWLQWPTMTYNDLQWSTMTERGDLKIRLRSLW